MISGLSGTPIVPTQPPRDNVVPKPLADQVLVIAGASSGIGRATALEVARKGAKVVCAARTRPALDSLVEEIVSSGGQAIAVPTDVAVPADVYSLAEQAESHFGRLAGLRRRLHGSSRLLFGSSHRPGYSRRDQHPPSKK